MPAWPDVGLGLDGAPEHSQAAWENNQDGGATFTLRLPLGRTFHA